MKIIAALIPFLVLCAPQALAATHSEMYNNGYAAGIAEWNQFNTSAHNFICPTAQEAPHGDFCKGYDAALAFENSDG